MANLLLLIQLTVPVMQEAQGYAFWILWNKNYIISRLLSSGEVHIVE